MKNYIVLLLFLGVLGIDSITAQKYAIMDKSPMDVSLCRESRNTTPLGKIYYSRPKLEGRALETLLPAGKVWRLGANEATELYLYQSITIDKVKIEKGRYTMYAVPNAGSWTILINKDVDSWGAYAYNESKDVGRFEVPTTKIAESVENFSIDFNHADKKIYFAWGTVQAALPFTINEGTY